LDDNRSNQEASTIRAETKDCCPTLGYRPPEILNNECIIENQQHCFLLVIFTE